jgi:cytosine/adenosine deaminase-related metal-dependent hydrolase
MILLHRLVDTHTHFWDMFSVMKLFQLIEAGRKRDELAITPRRLLELATIQGAKSIGMGDKIGSITVTEAVTTG